MSWDVVVLSPHLDDAALSCGGSIHRWVREGRRVCVLTVFAWDLPGRAKSGLALQVLGWMGLSADGMVKRRHEDLEACRRLGAQALQWKLPEAVYREQPSSREPLYDDLGELFAEVRPDDLALVPAIAERLAREIQAETVLVPLGVGGHVDHRLLRAAAEQFRPDSLVYFEEFPYSRRTGAVEAALGEVADWRAEVVRLEAVDVAARCHAISLYRSQLRPLFRGRWRMRRAVHQAIREHGGERLWHPQAGTEAAGTQ